MNGLSVLLHGKTKLARRLPGASGVVPNEASLPGWQPAGTASDLYERVANGDIERGEGNGDELSNSVVSANDFIFQTFEEWNRHARRNWSDKIYP